MRGADTGLELRKADIELEGTDIHTEQVQTYAEGRDCEP